MPENVALSIDFNGDVFEAQRQLRRYLLDQPVVRYAPARDLAAHMLLNLDDLPGCWSLATNWLRAKLGCQRVDAGFGASRDFNYFPSLAEAKNPDYDVPSFGGAAVFNQDPAMQAMWLGSRPVVFADITQDRRVSKRLRNRMSGAQTKSKFGSALRTIDGSYGLICADWTEHHAPSDSGLLDCFEHTVADVLSPVIAVSKQITAQSASVTDTVPDSARPITTSSDQPGADLLQLLTESEIEVARLAARGLSYKEIARIRDRSFSTIDHQLRSIRHKTGVTSTSALVSLLVKAGILAQ
ncbi:response regulator transcription factor [Labrenzia sp. PHM005]|uniref:response regulator transcription factor n=1 Tax=Labrenzia sp. PHM005 TaxID=2590016 RepID=UPI00114064CF|nr:helix-turn-helix transcriptional regulator [Labrenzia sp. PHM005]QDG76374.1 helix-turn-helix transcriptional regulator [Labrenzia sp. PHM005]